MRARRIAIGNGLRYVYTGNIHDIPSDTTYCHACGSTAHAVADCPHKDKTCSLCGKVGHLKARALPLR